MGKAKKDWQCQECGRRMTLRSAERAVVEGCVGCGGTDIDLYPVSLDRKADRDEFRQEFNQFLDRVFDKDEKSLEVEEKW